MRKRSRVWVLVILLIITVGFSINFLVPKNDNSKDVENVLGNTTVNYKNVPYISSIAPNSLYIGELFRYFVEISDLDTNIENISIFLTEKPQWMYIEGNEIRGVPLESGTYKFVVTVSDGVYSSSQVNYVLVQEHE